MVFAVLSILFTSSIMVMNTNTNQIDSQEDNIRAYYVARSGVDIAYAALMSDNLNGNNNFDQLLADDSIDFNDLKITDLAVPETAPIGTVNVEVSIVQNEGTGDEEVRIHAISQMIDDNESYTLAMYIKAENTEKTRWERE